MATVTLGQGIEVAINLTSTASGPWFQWSVGTHPPPSDGLAHAHTAAPAVALESVGLAAARTTPFVSVGAGITAAAALWLCSPARARMDGVQLAERLSWILCRSSGPGSWRGSA